MSLGVEFVVHKIQKELLEESRSTSLMDLSHHPWRTFDQNQNL
jgi:hypothetical protein